MCVCVSLGYAQCLSMQYAYSYHQVCMLGRGLNFQIRTTHFKYQPPPADGFAYLPIYNARLAIIRSFELQHCSKKRCYAHTVDSAIDTSQTDS